MTARTDFRGGYNVLLHGRAASGNDEEIEVSGNSLFVRPATKTGSVVAASARFAATAGCAVYDASAPTFTANLLADLITFDMSAYSPTEVQVRYHSAPAIGASQAGPIAPYVLIVATDTNIGATAASAIMGTAFFDSAATPAPLTGGGSVTMAGGDAREVAIISAMNQELDIVIASGASYLYAAAVYDGSGVAPCALEIRSIS